MFCVCLCLERKCSASPAASWVKRRKIIMYRLRVGSKETLLEESCAAVEAAVCLRGERPEAAEVGKTLSIHTPCCQGRLQL